MKVLLINGSPRLNGNTSVALNEVAKTLEENGIETTTFQVGTENIRGCIHCGKCHELHNGCIFDDEVNELAKILKDCDGLVIGSPVYYASANGTLISLLDRLFYSKNYDLSMKVGASVAVARRGGCSATFDELNKYFTISNMPIASSQYWNSVHGRVQGEANQDLEGLQTMRTLGKNMAFLIKSIQLGKEKFGLPKKETSIATDFIQK